MNTNDILKTLHNALVAKAQERIAVDGKAKVAAEIGNAIISYGKCWTEGLSDDGRLSDVERTAIEAKFAAIVDVHVPYAKGTGVKIAWDGLSFFGIGWQGLKHDFNSWFGLGL